MADAKAHAIALGEESLHGSLLANERDAFYQEAADLVITGMEGAISAKTVTYDFARLMDGAKEAKCSEFADAVIRHM